MPSMKPESGRVQNGTVHLFAGLLILSSIMIINACTTTHTQVEASQQDLLMDPADEILWLPTPEPNPTERMEVASSSYEDVPPSGSATEATPLSVGTENSASITDSTSSWDNMPTEENDIPPQHGKASWYNLPRRRTASGEYYSPHGMSAAHRSLPFDTIVEIECQKTGKTIRVRINDRGPYVRGCIIDLNREAAEKLGILRRGVTPVELRVVHLPKE